MRCSSIPQFPTLIITTTTNTAAKGRMTDPPTLCGHSGSYNLARSAHQPPAVGLEGSDIASDMSSVENPFSEQVGVSGSSEEHSSSHRPGVTCKGGDAPSCSAKLRPLSK